MPQLPLFLCIILLIGSCEAGDVPFVFDEATSDVADYTPSQIEENHISSLDLAGVPIITSPSDTEIIDMQDTGGGSNTNSNIQRNVGELRELFDKKVDFTDPSIRKKAALLAKGSSGERTIDQFCKIYDYMKKGDGGSVAEWSYLSDPREGDLYQSASETLSYGEDGDPKCVGVGDCDDFAILMAALVESIGGTTRIILAQNNITGGHAYTEIYLGNSSEKANQVEDIIVWLKQEYNTDKIYTHIDTDTRDVWLNLDWGPENSSGIQLYHPGGPFYQGDRHIVVRIRDDARKTYLNVPENYKKIKPSPKSAIPDNQPPTLDNFSNSTLWSWGATENPASSYTENPASSYAQVGVDAFTKRAVYSSHDSGAAKYFYVDPYTGLPVYVEREDITTSVPAITQ